MAGSDGQAGALTGPFMNVPEVAGLLDVSTTALYDAIKRGDAPVRTIRVGERIKVVTTSVLALLQGCDESEVVTSGETAQERRRSAAVSIPATSSAVKWESGAGGSAA